MSIFGNNKSVKSKFLTSNTQFMAIYRIKISDKTIKSGVKSASQTRWDRIAAIEFWFSEKFTR